MTYQPNSKYSRDLSVLGPPDAGELRREEESRPTIGELLPVGTVIRSSYGTGPYRIESVTRYQTYPAFHSWSLVLIDQKDGDFIRTKNDFCYINELVVEWDGEEPRFRKLFATNNDEVFIVRQFAPTTDRRGQMSLI